MRNPVFPLTKREKICYVRNDSEKKYIKIVNSGIARDYVSLSRLNVSVAELS